jgi:hypothetical protein
MHRRLIIDIGRIAADDFVLLGPYMMIMLSPPTTGVMHRERGRINYRPLLIHAQPAHILTFLSVDTLLPSAA